MIHKSNVTFRNHVADIDTINVSTDDNKQPMEICEITYPDGKVTAFPANDVSPEDGRKYRDIYASKYQAFKNGDPDADHVKRLEREIAERQNELDGLRKDDERVQENLGYGKVKPDENPHKIDQPVVLGAEVQRGTPEPVVPQPQRGTPVPR